MTTEQTWTVAALEHERRGFERELRGAGLKESSVTTYVQRSQTFVRWLAGEYQPVGPRD